MLYVLRYPQILPFIQRDRRSCALVEVTSQLINESQLVTHDGHSPTRIVGRRRCDHIPDHSLVSRSAIHVSPRVEDGRRPEFSRSRLLDDVFETPPCCTECRHSRASSPLRGTLERPSEGKFVSRLLCLDHADIGPEPIEVAFDRTPSQCRVGNEGHRLEGLAFQPGLPVRLLITPRRERCRNCQHAISDVRTIAK